MKHRQTTEPGVPMYPRSLGISVALLATLVVVALMATFLVTAF